MIFNVEAAKARATFAAHYDSIKEEPRDLYVERNMYATFGADYVKDEYLEVIKNGYDETRKRN